MMSLLKAGVTGFSEALKLSRDLVVIPTVALVSAVHHVGKAYLSRTDGPNRKPMDGHAGELTDRLPQGQPAPRWSCRGK